MIATMERVSLLDETDQLASMVLHSELYEKYKSCQAAVSRDKEAQSLIRQFKVIREKYDEVQRFGRYHPDYKSVIRQVMDANRNVEMNPLIADYKNAEKELNEMLGQVSLQLAHAVSASIKVPTGDPFFDRACSTGCGGGGKCKCHV
ncbi:YlbF family regulator [Sporolactobacillus shoreae]|uniref:YlbF family regulator n=1 Tax=Sporolactobacillus shoreae TaxID=1465501 RepID=A0A4Z0GV01_9BACL|nr:YlbF family regulator [Sporolactobacillus shoreae]TGB00186.1 YlbF family regulator [Sporolactobacillus shoreae]